MDIGKINGSININAVDDAKNKITGDSFEKHFKSALDKKDDKELKKVCQEFEAVLVNLMYKEMKATVPKSEFIQEDPGKDIFDSMLDDKLVDESTKGKGFGLADVLYKQLSKQLQATYKPISGGDSKVGEKK